MTPTKYRGVSGAFKSRELFVDVMKRTGHPSYTPEKLADAPYWLYRSQDHRPCARDLFLAESDPTGIKFAKKYLESYEHLSYLLRRSPWFRKVWEKWQEELALQIKSTALETIQDLAQTGGAVSLGASKYLANEEYNKAESEPAKRGRPSKEEVSGQLKNEIKKIQQVDEDLARAKNIIPFGGRAS